MSARPSWGTGGRAAPSPAPVTGPVRSVYVHAPFCLRRCVYCDFAVTLDRAGGVAAWHGALEAELEGIQEEGLFVLDRCLDTVFVGGGTPSVLGPEAMEGLARLLGPGRLQDETLEWTSEANPESFSETIARAWTDAGVNRFSFGAQSFQPEVLRWMGRLHGPRGVEDAVERARGAGIENLSIDLMFGLPVEVKRPWRADLESALALGVPHISLYGLTIEASTPLARAVDEGRMTPAGEDLYREEYLQANRLLTSEGYVHYEVSNFALPGFESKHNRACWEGRPYLGLGNSAHSYLPPLRRWNLRDWSAYQSAALEGRIPMEAEELLTAQDARLERVWLGLRTRRGLALDGLGLEGRALVETWVRNGLAEIQGERIVLTPQGWLLLDHLAVALESALADLE